MDKYDKIASFLRDRIYLIDITKNNNNGMYEYIFTVEDQFKNYNIKMNSTSIECSCMVYKYKMSVCRHIKFILEKINKLDKRRSKSCEELKTSIKFFYIDVKKDLDIAIFKCDRNPRYREYKILEDRNIKYSEKCYICLEKLQKKIIRCKHCNKYYHESCIYRWLRNGPACSCPNCRGQWY